MPTETYTDLHGRQHSLDGLTKPERAALERLRKLAATNPDWMAYSNQFVAEMDKLLTSTGKSRREQTQTVIYRVGQDLGSRLGVAQGNMRRSDYRDELQQLIATRFRTRREFCEATGLSEDMLSHVLAKRKNLAIDTLAEALAKVGFAIHITPMADVTVST
ncbi:MAG: hypothetical protein ACKVP0_02910 [Pirellulaceae bacterium]